jgi:lipoprotein signal peptidase
LEIIFGVFLRIWHVRNDAVAFSFGTAFPLLVKYVFFVILPLALMIGLGYVIVNPRFDGEISPFQHWLLAGIVGGGVGNLIDRLFRNLRVVDFISTRMYGAFGMEWFPTYNIADSAVVISVCLLLLSLLLEKKGKKSE